LSLSNLDPDYSISKKFNQIIAIQRARAKAGLF